MSDSKRNSTGSAYQNRANEFEQESGRATRARTRLIVEGFSNLALIATFFAGVQAQLISVTNNSDNDGPVSIATNAAFFGGLIFSVFTAVLATLSARWFSILREDDADYLSSRWLCQDSQMKDGDLLQNYLDHQIKQMEKIENGVGQDELKSQPNEKSGKNDSAVQVGAQLTQSINNLSAEFNPVLFDAKCILRLLKQERGYDPEIASPSAPQMPESTVREQILSYVLLSPLIACLPSFALFTAGILLLAWDKQPLAVAIFSSVIVFICIVPLCGFFIKHRHKHVISHIYLGRPSY
ncbi:hypothetical protein OPQ81_009628 [Rhizoctonia solani]|nr:hypothetical protein OPQ81_009628 [Rhizoctonia solani]